MYLIKNYPLVNLPTPLANTVYATKYGRQSFVFRENVVTRTHHYICCLKLIYRLF